MIGDAILLVIALGLLGMVVVALVTLIRVIDRGQ